MHLRNVSTFFQEEIFSATLSSPHPPHSYLLLSRSLWSLSGDFGLASFVFGSVFSYLKKESVDTKLKRLNSNVKSYHVVYSTTVNTESRLTDKFSEMHRPDFPRVVTLVK